MQSPIRDPKSPIVIAGGGPAGAALAIRLAREGLEVCLVERERFPRSKLCGEFISPECLEHFQDLGVLDELLAAGGDRISETIFYEPGGKSVSIPSTWLAGLSAALGLSRAEMDFRLLEQARRTGVRVFEETPVAGLLFDGERVVGVKARRADGSDFEIEAGLTVDATGRAGVLARFAERSKEQAAGARVSARRTAGNGKSNDRPGRLVGLKAHLENVHLEKGRCEIYFFRGGYGGLSHVEQGLANHCLLIDAETVKNYAGRADLLVENVVFENARARRTLREARPVGDWLAVTVDGFGVKTLNPAPGLFSVGDAAAFIDPFTGSGMLMALESAELLARTIVEQHRAPENIPALYRRAYEQKFRRRLRVCAFLRRAAFVPHLAKTVIAALSWSRPVQKILARATRSSSGR